MSAIVSISTNKSYISRIYGTIMKKGGTVQWQGDEIPSIWKWYGSAVPCKKALTVNEIMIKKYSWVKGNI